MAARTRWADRRACAWLDRRQGRETAVQGRDSSAGQAIEGALGSYFEQVGGVLGSSVEEQDSFVEVCSSGSVSSVEADSSVPFVPLEALRP